MKNVIKISAATIVVILISVSIIAFTTINTLSNRFEKKYTPNTPSINIPSDSISLARGKMLATALCTECHNSDYSGMEIYNDKKNGAIYSNNITPGGVTKNFYDAQWINVIRYGVKEDSTPVFIMPSSDDYNKMSDYDLGCIVAYLKTVKPSTVKWPHNKDALTFYGKIRMQNQLLGSGMFQAEKINMNDNAPRISPPVAILSAYGGYLVTLSDCKYCHGPHLNGAIDTGSGAPPAPNITRGGNFGHWTDKQFIQTIRSGVTSEGKHLSIYMPWPNIAAYNDTSLEAIYAYIKSLPVLKDVKR